MPISNITRTNTVDEWRIQTNLSADSLNKIETGNYDKTAGFLNIACTSVLSITSSGTGLSVANNALVSGDITVGKNIALGSEGAATGNLTIGANTFIYGKGISLFVANSATINSSLQVTESLRTNNITANTDASITGTAQIGYLTVNNYATVATTLDVVGNTTSGNLVTANSVVGDNGRFTSNVTASHFVASSGSLVSSALRVLSDANVGGLLIVTGNTNSGNLVTANAISGGILRVSGDATVGGFLDVSSDVTMGGKLTVTGNTTSGNLVTANAISGGILRVSGDATVGGNVTVTTNVYTGNLIVTRNVETGNLIVTNNINTGNIIVVGNTTSGNLVTANAISGGILRVSGDATAANVIVTRNVYTGNIIVTTNVETGNIIVTRNVETGNLIVTNNINTGNIIVTGNTTSGNLVTANAISGRILRTTGRADIGTELSVGTSMTVGGTLSVGGNFVLTGDIVYDTDVLSISTVTPVTNLGAGYFGVFRGNTIGGVTGHNGLANSDANAYIRWIASSNTWQIRDVFNPDVGTSYSKILTANLISSSLTSTSTDTFLSSLGANTLKNYTDTTFVKLSPGATQTISSDLTLGGNVTVFGFNNKEILLNSNYSTSSAPTDSAGILINRGNATNTYLRWNETIDSWVANNGTSSTSEFRLANSTTYLAEGLTNLYYTDTRARAAISHTTGSAGYNNTTGVITIPGSSTDISEGNKLFLTAARVRDNVSASNVSVSAVANTTQPLQYDGINGLFYHAASGVTTSAIAYYGSASQVATFQVSNTGHIIAASNVSIGIAAGAVSGLAASATTNALDASNINAGTLPAARLPAFSGDITTTSGSVSTTLATVNSTTGYFGGAATVPVYSVNGKGLITAAANVAISIASSAVSGLVASATTDTTNAANISAGTLVSSRLPAFSGDITTTAGSSATTLATVNATTGNFGGAATVPVFTVNGKGLVTYAGNVAISIASSAVSGLAASATTNALDASNINAGTLPAARLPAFSGDITTTAGSSATTLATVNSTTGYFGGAATVPVYSVNGKGLITAAANVAISIASSAVSGLAASATTNALDASNINAGTLSMTRLGTTGAPQFGSLGVGTAASGTTGEIRATGDIVSGYSDDKLKTRFGRIENALEKVSAISGFYYEPNQTAQDLGFAIKKEVGVSAQEIQSILPEVVVPAPVDSRYLTVNYERLVPLLIEAIKELKAEIEELKKK